MRPSIALCLLFALFVLAPVTAAPKKTTKPKPDYSGLRAGLEKGFCSDTDETKKDRVIFYEDSPRKSMKLVLKGAAARKWYASKTLGSCASKDPTWIVLSKDNVAGVVYRFGNGIIVTHAGTDKAFSLSWPIAQAWWPRSGMTVIQKQ